jgi:hypothetical protein
MPSQPKMHNVNCQVCSAEFQTTSQNLKRGYGKFCSIVCRRSVSQTIYTCTYCSSEFTSRKSRKNKSKTNNYFCSNDCKYKAASSLTCDYATGPRPKEIGLSTYRNRALIMLKNECVRCGYHEHVELLDVDHIDSNRQNNDITNLQILCVMCHAVKTRLPHLFNSVGPVGFAPTTSTL